MLRKIAKQDVTNALFKLVSINVANKYHTIEKYVIKNHFNVKTEQLREQSDLLA